MRAGFLKIFQERAFVLGASRFGVQAIAVAFTVAGLNSVVHIFGLPRPLFLASIVLAGMFFCGWGCPFGAVQEWARFLGARLGIPSLNIPNPAHRVLALARYALWALSLFTLWGSRYLPFNARRAFLLFFSSSPNSSGQALGTAALAVMAFVIILSFAMDRPYCKYVCGFGAEYGLLGLLRIVTIKRARADCVHCGKCDRACPMGVEVASVGHMRTANCINCFKCVAVCPVKGALSVGLAVPRPRDFKEALARYFSPKSDPKSIHEGEAF